MGRIRTIKPEFPQSESMGRVSRDARLTFILLWTLADDSGRLRGNSRMLASLLFPYDDDAPKKISAWMDELERERCLRQYCVDGNAYVEICNWLQHQKIDKPSASKLPAFESIREDSPNARECSSEDQGPRIKDQGPRKGPRDRSAHVYSEDFETFWQTFPPGRKTDKARAWDAWRKKVTDPAAVIAAAAEYASSPVGRGQYVKQPATWLNGSCWDDDRAAWRGTEQEPESEYPMLEPLP